MQKPILQALLVSDNVYSDSISKKKVIAGVLRKIQFFVPVVDEKEDENESETKTETETVLGGARQGGPSPTIFISLTEVYNTQQFELNYVRLEDDQIYFQRDLAVHCEDPLETVEVICPMPEIPISPGLFAVELSWSGETLGSFRILIEEIEDPLKK